MHARPRSFARLLFAFQEAVPAPRRGILRLTAWEGSAPVLTAARAKIL